MTTINANQKNIIRVWTIIFLIASVGQTDAATLTTPSYVITINQNCDEYVAVCDDVSYVGVNRKNNKSIQLKGRDLVHYCPDDQGDGPGKTPCHHIGYEFQNGKTKYYVGDDGSLEVTQGSKLLLKEQGTWDEEDPGLNDEVTSLETAIKAWAGASSVPPYKYSFVDLNEDGVNDAVVLITGRDYCGSGGCSLVIFRGIEGGFKLVSSSTITREPILLLQEKNHGWHSLSVLISGGGVSPSQVLMRFNGTKYPSNPSMQPKAKKNDLAGAKTLISENK